MSGRSDNWHKKVEEDELQEALSSDLDLDPPSNGGVRLRFSVKRDRATGGVKLSELPPSMATTSNASLLEQEAKKKKFTKRMSPDLKKAKMLMSTATLEEDEEEGSSKGWDASSEALRSQQPLTNKNENTPRQHRRRRHRKHEGRPILCLDSRINFLREVRRIRNHHKTLEYFGDDSSSDGEFSTTETGQGMDASENDDGSQGSVE